MILRRICLSFAVLLATLSLTRPGTAAEPRWVPLGPPAAPLAARLVAEPGNANRVYAFNEAGLWRSRDDAGSWRSIQVGLNRPPQAFTFDPSRPGRLYATVTEIDETGVVYRSDDFGDHWTALFRGGYASSYPQDLEIDPFAPDTLLWLTGEFLFRSRDAGRTWECFPVAGGCIGPVTTVLAFAYAPDRPGTIYVVGNGADFHTTHDYGRTWTTTGIPQANLDVLVATREPGTLYAWSRGDYGPCMARSDDEGATWKQILPDTRCGGPAIDPDDPHTVRMVVVDNGVPRLWVSRNGGDTWSAAGSVPEVGNLYVVPGGGLALATDRGFFRAPGEQGPWRASNRGFGASQVAAVLPAGAAVLAAPVQANDGLRPPAVPLLRTENGGRSWTPEPLTNALALAADPADPRHLIASALRYEGPYYTRHPRVLESLDGGDTWRGVVDPQIDPPLFFNVAIDPFEPRTFYAGTQLGGFYVSLDGGRTWRASNAGLRYAGRCFKYYCPPNWVKTLLPDPTQEGRIFILFNNALYSTLDGGLNWTLLRPQAPSAGSVHTLAREPQGALLAIGSGVRAGDSASLGVVYRSTDDGATWTRLGRLPVQPNVGRVTEVTGLAATRGALWVSTNFLGVLRSTDGGRTWKAANEGLPLLSVTSFVQDPEDPARVFVTIPGNGIYTLAP